MHHNILLEVRLVFVYDKMSNEQTHQRYNYNRQKSTSSSGCKFRSCNEDETYRVMPQNVSVSNNVNLRFDMRINGGGLKTTVLVENTYKNKMIG